MNQEEKLKLMKKYEKIDEAHRNKLLEYINEINDTLRFEVFTNGVSFWVSVNDIEKICTQISVSDLENIGVKFDPQIVNGEAHVSVNTEFLLYVQRNTKNPRFVPEVCLMKTNNFEYNYPETDYEQEENNIKK